MSTVKKFVLLNILESLSHAFIFVYITWNELRSMIHLFFSITHHRYGKGVSQAAINYFSRIA